MVLLDGIDKQIHTMTYLYDLPGYSYYSVAISAGSDRSDQAIIKG